MELLKVALLSAAVSTNLVAQDIKIIGTLDQNLKHSEQARSVNKEKTHSIKLLKMKLTPSAVAALNKRSLMTQDKSKTETLTPKLPREINLGMNNVPVLNQGHYGTCVTFANTAAIDAVLNKGDYLSQLCQLQLGNYLEANGYASSGWDGSWGRVVLAQMDTFGVISKKDEQQFGCGGLNAYPSSGYYDPSATMTADEFHELSQPIEEYAAWSSILDIFEATSRIDTTKTLNAVKQALNENDRVTFGVLLLDFDLGTVGAVGTHHATEDSWVLTPEIMRDLHLRPDFGGHEMIITGYDDDAIAVDDQGREYKGLLTLRNSWGSDVGDKGNFYMSYDYFKVLVIEAQRIRSLEQEE